MQHIVERNGRLAVFAALGMAVGSLLTGAVLPLVVGAGGPTPSALTAGVGGAGGGADAASAASGTQGAPGAPGVSGGAARPSADGGQEGRETGAAQPGGPLTASDQGVTPESIKVGFLLLDVGSVGAFGIAAAGVDPRQQEAAFRAYVDDLNERGGILGRRIEPVFASFDVISPAGHAEACRRLVVDEGAFVVVAQGGFGPSGVLCATQQYQRPLITAGSSNPDELFASSGGLLTALFPRANRMMTDVASQALAAGVVTSGTRVGLVFDQRNDPTRETTETMQTALERLGADVVHVTYLSEDQGTAASQVPVEVQQLQSSGAQVVFLGAATVQSTQIVTQATSTGFRPTWVASDWANMYADASVQNMPSSFEGAWSFTSSRANEDVAGMPLPEADQRCSDLYGARTGESLDRASNTFDLTMAACVMVDVLGRAATAAGPDLTAASFGAGVQAVGSVTPANMGSGGFGAGKFDLVDQYRPARFRSTCRCFVPSGEFRGSS